MGLDNGIMLRVRGELEDDCSLLQLPGIEKTDWWSEEAPENEKGYSHYDICYWRKCWNIRNDLFAACETEENDSSYYPMSVSNLITFRDELYSILCAGPNAWENPEGWSRGSIWTFEEAMNFLPWDIVRISTLIDYLQNEGAGRAEAYFYDSY